MISLDVLAQVDRQKRL